LRINNTLFFYQLDLYILYWGWVWGLVKKVHFKIIIISLMLLIFRLTGIFQLYCIQIHLNLLSQLFKLNSMKIYHLVSLNHLFVFQGKYIYNKFL